MCIRDRVILEVTPAERDDMADLTRTVMGDAFDLRVPLEVNLAFGPSWAEAKS